MKYNCQRNRPAFVRKGRRPHPKAIIDRYRFVQVVVSQALPSSELHYLCSTRFHKKHERFVHIMRKHDPIIRIDVD